MKKKNIFNYSLKQTCGLAMWKSKTILLLLQILKINIIKNMNTGNILYHTVPECYRIYKNLKRHLLINMRVLHLHEVTVIVATFSQTSRI